MSRKVGSHCANSLNCQFQSSHFQEQMIQTLSRTWFKVANYRHIWHFLAYPHCWESSFTFTRKPFQSGLGHFSKSKLYLACFSSKLHRFLCEINPLNNTAFYNFCLGTLYSWMLTNILTTNKSGIGFYF